MTAGRPPGSPKSGIKRATAGVAALFGASKRRSSRAAPLISCARPARDFRSLDPPCALYAATLFMQAVWGYSALKAGVAYLPLTAAVLAASGTAGQQ
jgi:hypothetical protein